ncbi:hypothetical protein MTR67_003022 [Solanum verrucosum]|uniref:Uncharacterized protein n=1 Tax=Solanum verrucosum TaxID=315347 RepID=A0AAF0T6H5_SOLVR|nr:hypothetical protein MTR67_003022 [Solanum verrucosum]
MKPLTDKDGSREKTQDILTTDIIESTSGTLQKQGGSPKLTKTACGINEMPVDDPEYLYLHHETIKAKWLITLNIREYSKRRGEEKETLLINYVLVLTLFADDYRSDPSDIANHLKINVVALWPFYEYLCCKLVHEKMLCWLHFLFHLYLQVKSSQVCERVCFLHQVICVPEARKGASFQPIVSTAKEVELMLEEKFGEPKRANYSSMFSGVSFGGKGLHRSSASFHRRGPVYAFLQATET